jgi:hypothetical protein
MRARSAVPTLLCPCYGIRIGLTLDFLSLRAVFFRAIGTRKTICKQWHVPIGSVKSRMLAFIGL